MFALHNKPVIDEVRCLMQTLEGEKKATGFFYYKSTKA